MKHSLLLAAVLISLSSTGVWAQTQPVSSPAVQPASAQQLGGPIVAEPAVANDRSEQLDRQAEAINQSLPERQQNGRDPVQQILNLPENVRIRPTRGGLGINTQL